jgi:hypothetical protein
MLPQSNITVERTISLASTDFFDKQGFFFRATGAGNIKYDPLDNDDGDFVTKAVDASQYFNDCVMAKKIYKVGTTATGIYIGKGI